MVARGLRAGSTGQASEADLCPSFSFFGEDRDPRPYPQHILQPNSSDSPPALTQFSFAIRPLIRSNTIVLLGQTEKVHRFFHKLTDLPFEQVRDPSFPFSFSYHSPTALVNLSSYKHTCSYAFAPSSPLLTPWVFQLLKVHLLKGLPQ